MPVILLLKACRSVCYNRQNKSNLLFLRPGGCWPQYAAVVVVDIIVENLKIIVGERNKSELTELMPCF